MTTLTVTGLMLAVAGAALGVFAYVGYPLLLRVLPRWQGTAGDGTLADHEWPTVTIVLPAYNEAHTIAATVESLLRLDYPVERLQILVVSDASTDGTDDIVRTFADRGVELHRMDVRRGKTAAENASRRLIRGSIVVNTDASVRVDAQALKPLVSAFRDPSVGIASGCDVSVGSDDQDAPVGEARYVGYEMWVRDLETRAGGIVGASGCLFASRPELHREIVPEALSRDFAAPLIAREHGYRSVSVPEAVCYVPRTTSLRREYRRKVRTMTRGLETLFYKRDLLNPLAHGRFAVMLWCHKLLRWLVPWGAALAVLGLGLAATGAVWSAALFSGVVLASGAVMVAAWRWPDHRKMPRLISLPGYVLFGLAAGLQAWFAALRGELNPVWEPTRRTPGATGAPEEPMR